MRHSISIPSSAFLKEAQKEYSGVNFRLICEIFQNSVDSGATKILCTFKKGVLVVQDSGSGMDESCLKNGMLTYAGSIKGENKIGNAGAAKKIILFAHESYRIETQDLVACGRGINYKLYVRDNFKDCILGTKITIRFAKNWPSYLDLEEVLYKNAKEIVSKSTLNAKIYWNGELLEQDKPNPIEIETETAIIRKSDHSGEIIVRFGGLYMFSQYSNSGYYYDCKGLGRNVLTQNRESFRHDTEYKKDFSNFIATLNNNSISGIAAQASYQKTKETSRWIEGIEYRGDSIPTKMAKRHKTLFAFAKVVAEMVGFELTKNNFGFYSDSCCRGLCSQDKIWLNQTCFEGENWEMDCINTIIHEICHFGTDNAKEYRSPRPYHDESFISTFGEMWVRFMSNYSGLNPLRSKSRIMEKSAFGV